MGKYSIYTVLVLIVLGTTGTAFANINTNEKIPVIIGFADKPEPALVSGAGGEIKYIYNIIPAIAARLAPQAVDALRQNPKVAYIEEDSRVYALGEYQDSWGVDRIDADLVHPYNKGTGIKIAIIDTGIDYTHPDLDANYRGGYDFVNSDADPMDDNNHGTHVAGTAAAEANGFGVIGVAPEANLYALKVLGSDGSGSYSNVIAAAEWSKNNGMDIMSLSLGSSADPGTAVHTAFLAAYNAGIVIVAAGGNSGNVAGSGNNIIYPAKYPEVIAVGATDKNNVRAYFSSTGEELELVAPGVGITSTVPGGGYASYSGTSMATPHVSGTAALVLRSDETKWPGITNGDGIWNNSEVRAVLQHTADDLGTIGKDNQYGYGLVDADQAAPQTIVDTTAPVISNVASGSITSSSATITWMTNEPSDSQVQYGTTISYGVSTPLGTSLVTSHSVSLTSLISSTTYHYRVLSKDAAGNLATSIDYNFTTLEAGTTPPSDTTPPSSITNLQRTTVTGSQIKWTWLDPTDQDFSKVMIFLNGIFQKNASKGDQNYTATGLSPNTLYTISTHTVDTSGNINLTWVNNTAKTKRR